MKGKLTWTILFGILALTSGTIVGTSLAEFNNAANTKFNENPAKLKEIIVDHPVHKKITNKNAVDIAAAKTTVDRMLKAWNKSDWKTVRSMVFHTIPLDLPEDWFINRPGKPVSYKIGTPYVVKKWTTPERGFVLDKQNSIGIGRMYTMEFDEAVSVPVTIDNNPSPTLLHVVQDPADGIWKVAFSKLNGFELFDHPSDLTHP
ncbi:MAG TPA: hypothetical protein VFV52_10700 [Bacilli bacterium]|nr:hypothetical protein [Bacilli bacterium]